MQQLTIELQKLVLIVCTTSGWYSNIILESQHNIGFPTYGLYVLKKMWTRNPIKYTFQSSWAKRMTTTCHFSLHCHCRMCTISNSSFLKSMTSHKSWSWIPKHHIKYGEFHNQIWDYVILATLHITICIVSLLLRHLQAAFFKENRA